MKPIFIISHKYYNGYKSYLQYYINNIRLFYNNALIIIVDNNSADMSEVFQNKANYNEIIFLENNIECKFELGAYQVGIKYLIDNHILSLYDYVICTQDTFILKNKYELDILKTNNISAAALVSWTNDWAYMHISLPILTRLNIVSNLECARLCWCNSFIISSNKIYKFYEYISNIIITTRKESEASERYMGKILWELNDGKNYDIDGDIDSLKYYCHTVNPFDDIPHIFCKISQQKNENTCSR